MNEELEKLKSLLYTDSLTQYGKRKLIKIYEDIIKKKDNQIDLMAEYWFFKEGKDLQLYIGGEGKMMGYLEKKEKVIEIYKQRFEKLVKEKGE